MNINSETIKMFIGSFLVIIIGFLLFNSCSLSKPLQKQSDMPEIKRKAGIAEQQWEENKNFKQDLMKYYNK